VIPIVNENDTVATHEIRFGDNDRLAALVAHVVQADALLLLSDVDGLYDSDPRRPGARLVDEVASVEDLAAVRVGRTGSSVGTGGMATKIDAAQIATGAGIPALLTSAEAIAEGLAGKGGTYFAATDRRTSSRLFWLRHATTPRGRLVLDDGAVRAVVLRRASLLPAGIVGVIGTFSAGDPVEIADERGIVVARGLVGLDSDDLPSLLGLSTPDIPAELRREAVHRDDLIVL
jgi:glutamate 5-kinase